jgi:hypothetical protein
MGLDERLDLHLKMEEQFRFDFFVIPFDKKNQIVLFLETVAVSKSSASREVGRETTKRVSSLQFVFLLISSRQLGAYASLRTMGCL